MLRYFNQLMRDMENMMKETIEEVREQLEKGEDVVVNKTPDGVEIKMVSIKVSGSKNDIVELPLEEEKQEDEEKEKEVKMFVPTWANPLPVERRDRDWRLENR